MSFLPPGRRRRRARAGCAARSSPATRGRIGCGARRSASAARTSARRRRSPTRRGATNSRTSRPDASASACTKSGYVTMQYGQNRPFEPGRPIELADGQSIDKVDVALPRGSVSGRPRRRRVRRGGGRRDVTAMRMQYQNGGRRMVPSGRNALDERSRPVPPLTACRPASTSSRRRCAILTRW